MIKFFLETFAFIEHTMVYFLIKIRRSEKKDGKQSKWVRFSYCRGCVCFFCCRQKKWQDPLPIKKALRRIKHVGSVILIFSSGSHEVGMKPHRSIKTVDQLSNFLQKLESNSDSDLVGNDESLYT